jgi:hypothetical protein
MNVRSILAFGFAVTLCSTDVRAEVVSLSASIAGANEVPPVATQGTGTATVSIDTETRLLQWNVQVGGLSGPISAAHFHCPATTIQNAPISIPIAGAGAESPLHGSIAISPEQMANILGGRCYINVHTALHPPGEVRGQVVRP